VKFKALIRVGFCLLIIGCTKVRTPETASMAVSPGAPRHWDVGDRVRSNALPQDVADGYLEFARSPGSSYGVTLAHERLSARNHERSDLLFYIHSGVARFQVGEKSFTATNGDMVYIPRGAVYSAEAMSKQKLELLTIYTPPLDPADIVYHEAAERIIPMPSGKKLRVKIDTTSIPPDAGTPEEEDFLDMQDYEEVEEEK